MSKFYGLQNWLTECLHHEDCRKTGGSERPFDPYNVQLPTRCLNVGTTAEPRLFIEETGLQTGAYITLSHRWSHLTEMHSTNQQNYQERLAELNIVLLPQVFQEAVELTRYLGVNYLWIDSICIIQQGDDGKDWEAEAGMMAAYYQHCLLTLMAVTSDRLFPEISALSKKRLVRLPYREDGRQQGHIYLYKVDVLNETYERKVRQSELFSRAWVLQEFLLSRRVVYCTDSTFIFECQTKRAISQHPDKAMARLTSPRLDKAQFYIKNNSITFSHWYKFAAAFSGLHLTYPDKDRVIALSGLKVEFKNAISASDSSRRYVEGIWIDHAYVGLLWRKTSNGRFARLGSHPTWSWTSFYGEVKWPNLPKLRPAFISLQCHEPMETHSAAAAIVIKSKIQRVIVDRFFKGWEMKHFFEAKICPAHVDDHYRAVRTKQKSRRLCGMPRCA